MKALNRASLLSIAVLAALSGCSKEEEPAKPNAAPTITLSSSSIAVNEGEVGVISYTVADEDSSTSGGLRISLHAADGTELTGATQCLPSVYDNSQNPPQLKSNGGCVSIAQGGKVNYTAPWLSLASYKTHTESFKIRVTDASGAYAEKAVTTTVKDRSSVAKLSVSPPSGASGWQNTQKPAQINFWYPESTSMELAFDLSEEDHDAVEMDISVTEGVIYKNQIQRRLSADGSKIFLTVPIPAISTPSADIVLSLLATDGDGSAKATANITVVNKPVLTWSSSAPMEASEKTGGQLPFSSSELPSYAGTYEVRATMPDGSTPPFTLPVSVSSDKKSVVIGASSGFQGDQVVQIDLTLTNKITHAGGESYNEVTRLTRTITLKDDRDDDFESSLQAFYKLSEQVNKAKIRRDEERIASAYTNYFFLNGFIKSSEMKKIKLDVATALDKEYADLASTAQAITKGVSDNIPLPDVEKLISDYTASANKLGFSAREVLFDESARVAARNTGKKVALKQLDRGGVVKMYSGALTHYIGNVTYGTFEDAAKTKWVFSPGFEQLAVVDYSSSYCF